MQEQKASKKHQQGQEQPIYIKPKDIASYVLSAPKLASIVHDEPTTSVVNDLLFNSGFIAADDEDTPSIA